MHAQSNQIRPTSSMPEELMEQQLQYLQKYSAYYSWLFSSHDIDLSSIKTIRDLEKIPVTTRQDLQTHRDKFICIQPKEIKEYVTTSGTTGIPFIFPLSNKDIHRLARNEELALGCAGVSDTDIVQLTVTLDKTFMAGLAYLMGTRSLQAAIVRVGPGMPEMQWHLINKLKSTVLIAVPSFVIKMLEYADQQSIDYKKSSVRMIICVGEPIRNIDFTLNEMGSQISIKWQVPLFSTYASTEMSTAFTECEYHQGGHLLPDLIIAELLDEQNNPVGENEAGELVVTTLGVECMPLLRYKTGDICHIHYGPCKCGRDTPRIGPIIGRKNQMIKYKGTTLFPAMIMNTLYSIISPGHFVIICDSNAFGMDELTLYAHLEKIPSEAWRQQLDEKMRATLRVVIPVEFVPQSTIDKWRIGENLRKPQDFIDKRIKMS